MSIHNTAIISPKAKIGKNIQVDPFAIIKDDVTIGDNCKIGPNVVIYNGARIGNNVKIFQGASISNDPQDLKYAGEETLCEIGDKTVIREFATIHKGTIESGITQIGENCLLMAYSHVAHDTKVGNNCILANIVQLGGHVEIEDWTIIGGGTSVHQFSKIGQHSMIAGGYRVTSDVPPYVLSAGEPLKYNGLNTIGLRRRGFKNEDIMMIKDIYRIIFSKSYNLTQAKKIVLENYNNTYAKIILNFIDNSDRGIIR